MQIINFLFFSFLTSFNDLPYVLSFSAPECVKNEIFKIPPPLNEHFSFPVKCCAYQFILRNRFLLIWCNSETIHLTYLIDTVVIESSTFWCTGSLIYILPQPDVFIYQGSGSLRPSIIDYPRE